MVGIGVRQMSVRGELCQEARVDWPTHGGMEGKKPLKIGLVRLARILASFS